MPSREINLSFDTRRPNPNVVETWKFIKRFLPPVLGIYAAILLGVLGYSFYLTRTLDQLDASLNQTREQIKSLARNEGMYLVLKQKAQAVAFIQKNRYPFADQFAFYKNLELAGGILSNLSLNGAGQTTFTVHIDDTPRLDGYINVLVGEATQKFHSVELNSIGFNPDGSYNIGLNVSEIVKKSL